MTNLLVAIAVLAVLAYVYVQYQAHRDHKTVQQETKDDLAQVKAKIAALEVKVERPTIVATSSSLGGGGVTMTAPQTPQTPPNSIGGSTQSIGSTG